MPQCLTPGMEDWFGKEGREREGAGRRRGYKLKRGRKKGSELSSMMTEGKRGRGQGIGRKLKDRGIFLSTNFDTRKNRRE